MASLPGLPSDIPDLSQIQNSLGGLFARLRSDADGVVNSLAKQCQVLSSSLYGSNVPQTVQATTPPEEDRRPHEKRPSVQSRDGRDKNSTDTNSIGGSGSTAASSEETRPSVNSILFLREEEAKQECLQSWYVYGMDKATRSRTVYGE